MATRCFLHWPNHLKHFSNRLTVNSLSSGTQATTLFQLQTCTHQASDCSICHASKAQRHDLNQCDLSTWLCTLKCKFSLKNCVKMKTDVVTFDTFHWSPNSSAEVAGLLCSVMFTLLYCMQFSEHNFLKMVMMNHYTKLTCKMFERYGWPLYYWSSLWPWPWSWQTNFSAWCDSLGYTIPSLVTV